MQPRSVRVGAPCETRRKLAEQFAIAARLYAETAAFFAQHPGDLSENDLAKLRIAAREAQQRSEEIHTQFEEHIESHGCLVSRH